MTTQLRYKSKNIVFSIRGLNITRFLLAKRVWPRKYHQLIQKKHMLEISWVNDIYVFCINIAQNKKNHVIEECYKPIVINWRLHNRIAYEISRYLYMPIDLLKCAVVPKKSTGTIIRSKGTSITQHVLELYTAR